MTDLRVVSLLPSATELVCAIGGERLLVGRSHECDWPASVSDRPVLTSQKTVETSSAAIDAEVRAVLDEAALDQSLYELDIALLRTLQPDVILTQDLCAVCSIDLHTVRTVAAEMEPTPDVVSLNPAVMEDVFDDLLRVGDAINHTAEAQRAMVNLRGRYWSAVDYVNAYIEGPQTVVLEWMDPLFVAGHWTPGLVVQAGGRHDLNPAGAKSRQISAEELVEVMPERLVICPCGFSLAEIRRDLETLTSQRWWSLLPAVADGQVMLVDGNQMFSRPGPRLVDAFCWLVAWLNGRDEVMPDGFPAEKLPS